MATKKGTSKSEKIKGTNLDDSIFGFDGNDTITATKGNDVIDGGNGDDTVIFQGLLNTYEVTSEDGVLSVVDDNGESILTNVEYVQFSDGTFTTAGFAVDQTAPEAPTIDTIAGDDIVDYAELEAGVIVTGTAEAGAAVRLAVNDAEAVETAVNEQGIWSYAMPADFIVDGELRISAIAIDAAGNESETTEYSVTVDLTPPDTEAPVAPFIDSIAEDNVINAAEKEAGIAIVGTAEAGSVVTLTFLLPAQESIDLTDLETAVADANAFLEEAQLALEEAQVVLDDAQVSLEEADEETLEEAQAAFDEAQVNYDETQSMYAVAQVGYDEAQANLDAAQSASVEPTVIFADPIEVDAEGNWSYEIPEEVFATNGEFSISAVATDAAGNQSEATEITVAVNLTALPSTLIIDSVTGDNVVEPNELENGVFVSGTADVGSVVVLSAESFSSEVEVSEDGTWTYEMSAGDFSPPEGSSYVSISAKSVQNDVESDMTTTNVLVVSPVNWSVGDEGKNTLSGKNLYGGEGADTLKGNTEDGLIIGGAGKDLISGGKGNDIFIFLDESDSGILKTDRDVIKDFKSGQDKIDLSHFVKGDVSGLAFIDINSFNNSEFPLEPGNTVAQVRFSKGILSVDSNADNKADFSVELTGVKSFLAEDLIF